MNLSITMIDRPGFARTRARLTDSDTSHAAAKNAVSRKAVADRLAIHACILQNGPLTAMEVASLTGIDYYAVQRRISECGLHKTDERRDGRAIWAAA